MSSKVGSQAPPTGLTFTRYPGINRIHVAQGSAGTAASRDALLAQIQQKITADRPDIELQVAQNIWLISDKVRGLEPTRPTSSSTWRRTSG